LTFKYAGDSRIDPRALAETRWTFAHAHGISLGRLTGTQLGEQAQQTWELAAASELAESLESLADIHVWQHSLVPVTEVGELGDLPYATPLSLEVDAAIRAAAPVECRKLSPSDKVGKKPRPQVRRHPTPRDALVLDVILLSPGEWLIGYHRATTTVDRWPGGFVAPQLPPHAVSRAYAKLEEVIRWSGLPVSAGDECVEIGCAPGGASQALLDRGMFVTGIDPANVDAALVEHPRFRHLKKRGADVRRQEFLGVRWLIADMNIAPQATLAEVEPIVTHPGVAIRGMVLTLKMSDWNLAERLDEFVSKVRGWGYRDVRVRQLTTGGQEVCLVALRRKALRRLGKKSARDSRPSQTARRPRRNVAAQSVERSQIDATSPAAIEPLSAPEGPVSSPDI
jgi:23S rRNA (cytidine2498-2'-O)-methyltransferase